MPNTAPPDADQQQPQSHPPIHQVKSKSSLKSSVSSNASSDSASALQSGLFSKTKLGFQLQPHDDNEQSTALPPDFNFNTNYREILNQDSDFISPSSSNTSLVSYFKRHHNSPNSGTNSVVQNILHSIAHRRSTSPVPGSSASSIHSTSTTKSYLRPGCALNKVKSSVINHKKNKKNAKQKQEQEQHLLNFPLVKVPTSLSKLSLSTDTSKSQPLRNLSSSERESTFVNSPEIASLYSSRSANNSGIFHNGPLQTNSADTSSRAQSTFTTSDNPEVMYTNDSSMPQTLSPKQSIDSSFDNSPLSSKTSLFSPRFLKKAGKASMLAKSENRTVTQPTNDNVFDRVPSRSSTPSYVPNDQLPSNSQYLTMQDLQDVSPLSSFSGPSSKPQDSTLSFHDPTIIGQGVTDTRRPSYSSQITTSSEPLTMPRESLANDDTTGPLLYKSNSGDIAQNHNRSYSTATFSSSPSKINSAVFSQPDKVFDNEELERLADSKQDAEDSNKQKAEQHLLSSDTERHASKPKSKKFFLGKLISRRESSTDFSEKSKKRLKSKTSESLLKSNWAAIDPHSTLYVPGNVVGGGLRARIRQNQHLKSKFKRKDSVLPVTTTTDNDIPPTTSASAPHSPIDSTFYTLDTDLEHMSGIVDGDQLNASSSHLPSTSNSVGPSLSSDSTFSKAGKSIDASVAASVSGTGPKGSWQAPESWNIVPDSTDLLQWPSDYDSISPGHASKGQKSFVRIFREDGTFGTISCDLEITVTELIQLLGRKFYLPSVAGYQLTVRTGGLRRILLPKERPLIYQQILLNFMGYTEDDKLSDVARDDLSYMCRFELSRLELRRFTTEEKELMSRDFSHANMQNMDLQTIPVIYYSHCLEIEHLDVSENPSITIPFDFIQACVNLKSIRYVSNKSLQFPLNILHTVNLRNLNLSKNLITHLDNVDFTKLASLVVLDLHGNRLSSINDSISKLTCLEELNLSSNVLTGIDVSLCQLTNLKSFDISFNKIHTLPDEVGLLSNLVKFSINNNYLEKKLPDTLVNMSSLEDLDVRFNKLQNIDILSKVPNLLHLYCSKNSVTSFSAEFVKLELFHFDRNPLTKIELVEGHFSMVDLNLSKAKLAALDKTFLEKIPHVQKLILDKNHLSCLPPHIAKLKHLVHLSVVANNLDTIPPEIGQLHELKDLDLHNNNIPSLPDEIWMLENLETLNVSSNLIEVFPKHDSKSSISSSESDRFKAFGDVLKTYEGNSPVETAANDARRPSTLSLSSGISPNERRLSVFPPGSARTLSNAPTREAPALRPRRTLGQSLLVLTISDNRLTDDCFEEITNLTSLKILNLSYNELVDIPYGALRRLVNLNELYLSGNHLTSLPAEDIESIKALRVLYVNSNKLHTLPAELGKLEDLTALDVGSNNLKYNINNWPYDWNWNWNLKLKYLNFSGNRRLEIKAALNQVNHFGRDLNEKDWSDFTVLDNIRVLGLMDVTLITPKVPDQTENCRVRTYGSEMNSLPFGMADSLGYNNNLSVVDMVLERFRGKDNETVVGLFDGRSNDFGGNKVSKLIQETFGSIFSQELNKLRENESVKEALRRAFLNTNKEIGNTTLMPPEEIAHSPIAHRSSTAMNLEYRDGMTGSCATVIYIQNNKLYVANSGDSMAIISGASGQYKVLTTRHDPTTEAELVRIRAAAGVVSSNGKLDGSLDVSRAIGFYNLIPQIHAKPSISEYDLSDNDEVLVIGSKQLWEHVSYQIALDVVRMSNGDMMRAAAKLRDFAISYGASDKIMVMVIGVGISRRKSKNRIICGGTFGPMSSIGEEELFPVFKKRRDRNLLPEDSRLARLGGEVDPPVDELAMVFTDIKNSTLLWETAPVAMRAAIKVHNSIMRRQLRIIGGYEVKTEGDAFMVSFPTPTSALLWCFSVQSLLLAADWPTEILESSEGCEILDDNDEVIFRGLSVRMGIHWGSPVCERDPITRRMDYFGPMVNRAARVSAVADGGQIALSSDFVVEMTRLIDAVEEYKQGKVPALADAFGGNEALGLAIEHDAKLLNNLGWERKILGEEKLKGLENPEFISLAYQKSLLGRYPIHCERLLMKRSPTQVGLKTKTTVSQHQMDLIIRLREISIRLENVCTRLNPGNFVPKTVDVSSRITNIVGLTTLVAPCSESDYAIFMSHLVTRIENCLSTLYLRAAVSKLNRSASISLNVSELCGFLSNVLGLEGGQLHPSAEETSTSAPSHGDALFSLGSSSSSSSSSVGTSTSSSSTGSLVTFSSPSVMAAMEEQTHSTTHLTRLEENDVSTEPLHIVHNREFRTAPPTPLMGEAE